MSSLLHRRFCDIIVTALVVLVAVALAVVVDVVVGASSSSRSPLRNSLTSKEQLLRRRESSSSSSASSSATTAATLFPPGIKPLPLGNVTASGWLGRQLTLQATGLAGHLQRFWPNVQNSTWIGGNGPPPIPGDPLTEDFPYWLNGAVPLLFQLSNQAKASPLPPAVATLREQIMKFVEFILEHQTNDGWLGPDRDYLFGLGTFWWARYDTVLALENLADGLRNSDPALSRKIMLALEKFFTFAYSNLKKWPLKTWSAARWQDFVLGVQWMYDHDNSTDGRRKPMYLDLMHVLQKQGMDWVGSFFNSSKNFPKTDTPQDAFDQWTHGVNVGQAIKTGSVWYRVSGDANNISGSYIAYDVVSRYYGQATGMFAADEHLASKMPSRGTELCNVVETMFSLETIFYVSANATFGDFLERVAFNALPAEISEDMWSHQYLQQVNGFQATYEDPFVFGTDGPDSASFGLAPNYPCCTANFGQGWSKFVMHLLGYRNGKSDQVALTVYAPYEAETELAHISMQTNYPFEDNATVVVTPHVCHHNRAHDGSNTSSNSTLTLWFRVPSFVNKAIFKTSSSRGFRREEVVVVNNNQQKKTKQQAEQAEEASWHPINVQCCGDADVKNQTTTTTTITVNFDMSFFLEKRFNDAVSVFRGPLLFGVHPSEHWKSVKKYKFKSQDWHVTNASRWNYALRLPKAFHDDFEQKPHAINKKFFVQEEQQQRDTNNNVNLDQYFELVRRPGGPAEIPFNTGQPPVVVKAKGSSVFWGVEKNAAAPPPRSPVVVPPVPSSALENLTLLPYGATRLRLAELPWFF